MVGVWCLWGSFLGLHPIVPHLSDSAQLMSFEKGGHRLQSSLDRLNIESTCHSPREAALSPLCCPHSFILFHQETLSKPHTNRLVRPPHYSPPTRLRTLLQLSPPSHLLLTSLLSHAGHRSQDQPSAQDCCRFMESSSPACDPAAPSPGSWPHPQQPHECK